MSRRTLARSVLGQQRVNALPRLREDRELRAAGILQIASEALPLALRAGGGNEEPIRDGDREQQRCDAFEQLPTRTHANPLLEIPAFSNAGGAFCDRRTAMLLAKPEAGKRRCGPGSSAGSR
jgi:hypothetical protein